ncbi:MAG: tRNA (adenosine(37)-N6)-threonylcarbamoyltransferase complex ATPase subunit type 1 TsaE [Bacteroidota bacterium]
MANSASHSKKLVCESINELQAVATDIISFSKGYLIWVFNGEMGAGKTTMISAVCKQLGVVDNVASPTFSIVNEYLTKDSKTINHFDFYRIKDQQEALDIGVDDYFYSGNYCFIEWPSKIDGLIPSKYIGVNIIPDYSERRIIEVTKYD